MKESAGFYHDIAPVIPIPPGKRQSFTYLSDTEIPRGSLVSIPFRSFVVRGVVLSSSPIAEGTVPSGRIKRVTAVVREAFLTDTQISLAESVSHDCLTSLGRTMRHFLPAIVMERAKGKEAVPRNVLRLTDAERLSRHAFARWKSGTPLFLGGESMTALRVCVAEKRSSRSRHQFLVLVPETVMLPFVERFLLESFGRSRIAVLESRRPTGAFFSAWEAIRSGDADVVVGTRQAVFAPFRNLSFILVLGEGEVLGYKQWDMSPRYDARRIVETLARDSGARLVFSDTVASLDMRYRIMSKDIVDLPSSDRAKTPEVVLVNMREERWKKNRSILSEAVIAAIGDARKNGRRSLVIVSRSGLDSFSVCESCRTVPRCPACDRALRSTRDGHFACPSCTYKTTSFPRCRQCGSLSFRNVGSGTEKIERELARRFPGAKLTRIDEAAVRTDKDLRPETLFKTIGSADILVGTPALLNIPYLPDTGPVAIMDTDNFLSLPDFRGDERFLRMMSRCFGHVGRNADGKLLLQTFHPDREFFDRIRQGDLETPLGKVALDREALRYPPYRTLFRIGFRERSEAATEQVAAVARERLLSIASSLSDTDVSPVIRPLLPKIRGRYVRFLHVSVPSGIPFPDTMRDTLLEMSGAWFFEEDPLSVL